MNSAGIRTYHTILPICVVVDFKSFLYKLNKQIIRNHCNLILPMEYSVRVCVVWVYLCVNDGRGDHGNATAISKNLLPKKNEHPIKISENRIFAKLNCNRISKYIYIHSHTLLFEKTSKASQLAPIYTQCASNTRFVLQSLKLIATDGYGYDCDDYDDDENDVDDNTVYREYTTHTHTQNTSIEDVELM